MGAKRLVDYTNEELAAKHRPEVGYKFCEDCHQNSVVWGDAVCDRDHKNYRYSRCLCCGCVHFMKAKPIVTQCWEMLSHV